jgi:hypothetical protein
MNRDQLLEILDKNEIAVWQRDLPGGGTVVVSQYGARILGLFPCCAGSSRSSLWVNPHLAGILSGKALDWDNDGDGAGGIGGDRLWVSPEQNFYYHKPAAFEDWFAQSQMDPGSYRIVETGAQGIRLRNSFDLEDILRGVVFHDVKAERFFTALENPLLGWDDPKVDGKELGYAGLEVTDQIEVPGEKDAEPLLCPWNLTQVPMPSQGGSGTVVVPTGRRATPIGYFGDIPPDRIRVHSDHAIFRIDGQRVTKLGILAEDLPMDRPAQIAYLRPVITRNLIGHSEENDSSALKWSLIVRESSDVARDSAEALDPAAANPNGPRGVLQSYNSGGNDKIQFGEIEMQFKPLVRDTDGVWRRVARSRVMAWFGDHEEILRVASRVLGVSNIDLFG